MGLQRLFNLVLVLGTFLVMMGTLLFFKQGAFPLMSSNHHLIAQNTNTYLGPHSDKSATTRGLVRVQISVYDDPNPQGVQIKSAEYDQKEIPLKPRDIYGFRGQASFQNPPGKYTLKWTVQRDKTIWPRTVNREEEVTLDPRDLWVQITITGETAVIN